MLEIGLSALVPPGSLLNVPGQDDGIEGMGMLAENLRMEEWPVVQYGYFLVRF